MTKEQALTSMKQGKKVSHRYFDDDEYIYIKDGKMLTEDGYRFEEKFKEINDTKWNKDWCIYYE